MIIGVPKEICPGETRVALVPANVAALIKKGREIIIESGAGVASGYPDQEYAKAGAKIEPNRAELFKNAKIILQVQAPGSNTDNGADDLSLLSNDHTVIGMMDPLANPSIAQNYAKQGVTALSMELIPRITRAQSMDVLSSMATIAGYKSILIAAERAPRMFPMFMTAAGTVKPARVFIMGAGVAGLQAAATAKRLGAVVEAYDVRPAAREQILSVGAKPVELDLDTGAAEGSGGYAKEQGEDFLTRQRELMAEVLSQQDIVVTTAAIPGAKSPILVTAEMVAAMKPGSVIVDLAAERGGNCDLTKLDEVVVSDNGVIVMGPKNVPSSVPFHASQMYGKNVENLLNLLFNDDGQLVLDFEDEVVSETCIANNADVPQARIRDLLGLAAVTAPASEASNDAEANKLEEA